MNVHSSKPDTPRRGVVIPVLDYSPASTYNILTLLDDLSGIDCEVIVIFNSEKLGEELRCHPRITRYAIMKQNLGVARAWNIGLQMAESDMVHIVNSDAHISLCSMEAFEHGLTSLENAICTGAEGSRYLDLCFYSKGSFSSPVEVDSVSGFFFCVNKRLMSDSGISFETMYTPCYFEEWDFGFQAKRAGLKCWLVPTVDYDHHRGGTINALKAIPYMGREEGVSEILDRNRSIFINKWSMAVKRSPSESELPGNFQAFLRQRVLGCLEADKREDARDYAEALINTCSGEPEAIALGRYALQQLKKLSHVSDRTSEALNR